MNNADPNWRLKMVQQWAMVSHHVYEGSIYMNVLRNDHLQIVLVDNDETLGILHETMGTVDMMVMELSKNPGVPLFMDGFCYGKSFEYVHTSFMIQDTNISIYV